MATAQYELKCDVTQDGAGFDNPSRVLIRKRPRSPISTEMVFPNLHGKFSDYFASTDIIAVYLGLDVVETKAIVMGYPYEVRGRSSLTVGISDLLSIVNRRKSKLWKNFNFDGKEAGLAIRYLLDDTPQTMYSQTIDTTGLQGTNPRIILEDDLRYESYVSNLKIIQDITDRCWDTSGYPLTPLGHTFWMLENRFNFRKMQRISEADAVLSFSSTTNIFRSRPTKSLLPMVNKATVLGKVYTDLRTGDKRRYEGSYSHQSSITAFGEHHQVYQDDTLTSKWQCENKAARIVMASKVRTITSQIVVPDLFTAIPDVTIIDVNDTEYGLSGNYGVAELSIGVGAGNSRCNATLNNVDPVMTDFL